jgi:hypothetical protein
LRGAGLPLFAARSTQRIAELTPTENRAAAARRDTPDATAATTRARKSQDRQIPMTHFQEGSITANQQWEFFDLHKLWIALAAPFLDLALAHIWSR